MRTTIQDLLQSETDFDGAGSFEITGTSNQIDHIREDLRTEWSKSGLMIITENNPLPTIPFDTVSFGGITVKFIIGDYFSIKKI